VTTSIQPTLVQPGQLSESGKVLARAFYDDPMMSWVLPDDARRLKALEWFMTVGAKYGTKYGEVYTTGTAVEGDAVWLRPGEAKIGPLRMLQNGMLATPFKFGLGPFGRFLKIMNVFEHLHERDMPQPHWYLMILGVDPPRQGQGVGGALMQPILARADAASLPCYLETQKTINVPFYQKHGFEVVVEDDIPGGGPHYWTMKRPARG
jgi:GNAT superfamily N-acetyltransferase